MHPERAFPGRRSGPALVPRPVGSLPRPVGSTPGRSARFPARSARHPTCRLASPAGRLASPAGRLDCRLVGSLLRTVASLPRQVGSLPRFAGTLGVDRSAPAGFQSIRLFFDLESSSVERGPRCLGRNYGALLRRVPDARLVAAAKGHLACALRLAARSRTSRASNAVKPAQWGSSPEDFRRSTVVVLVDLPGARWLPELAEHTQRDPTNPRRVKPSPFFACFSLGN